MSYVREALVLAFISCAAWPVQGALVSIQSDGGNSTEGLGTFTGSMNYSFADANNAQIEIKLKNTSPVDNGGFITAFAFNLPSGITGVSLSTATNLDNILGGPSYSSSVAAPPFGDFDVGASLTSNWLGGGGPNGGIGVGVTGSWTFTFTGTGLNLLTTGSFIAATTDGEFLLVRYRGFDDGGSDKVPTDVVPEASSFVLMGLGVLTAGAVARRRRK